MTDQPKYYENKLKYEIDSLDLFDALNIGEKIKVIDARLSESYNKENIPHALNIPHCEMNNESTKNLDK